MMKKLFEWAIDKGNDERLSLLQKVSLFKGLSNKLLLKLMVDLVEKEYRQGELIFAEGDTGKALYIILNGSVEIGKRCGNEDRILATLSTGSFFGELALIDQVPRFASATARETTTLLIMYKSYFDDLIRADTAISSRLLLNLVELLATYVRKNHAAYSCDRDEKS